MLYFLEHCLSKRRKSVNRKFNRVLSVGDYLSDRWEKAKYLGFGDGTSIYDSSLVFGDVVVGENCWIGPFTILDGSAAKLKVGDRCDISAGVQIYTHDTSRRASDIRAVANQSVVIGDNCYLGPNVVVAMGVTIGNDVIVGANSFVNKDIPDGVTAVGCPATVKKPV